MFQPVDGNVNFPAQELAVGRFWKERDIYRQSLAQRKDAEPFVFYEGPPTANGMPHPGHCLTRAIKDLFPRYQTMRGRLCERKAGWDTHGLPVEVEVSKELGIHTKEEIENYKSKDGGPDGVEGFIQLCQKSVWRYMQEWRRLTERLGFWVDLDDAYVTYHQSYVESVWWSLKNLFDRGLLYQGHKIVWWWAQGGTALSAGEVGQGYRQVADPSVYVKFPLLDDAGKTTDTSLLVWTTTPWTLPSNQFVAVNRTIEYVLVEDSELPIGSNRLILAAQSDDRILEFMKKESSIKQIRAVDAGAELIGRRYRPPFDETYSESFYKERKDLKGKLRDGKEEYLEWRVVEENFVTTDSGTGIVHIAPAFGEDDYKTLIREQERFDGNYSDELPVLLCAVDPNGKFNARVWKLHLEGTWVKDGDKEIIAELKSRDLLYHRDQYLHDYPFCWRAEEDPLIQYPRESWFIRTTKYKDQLLANNSKINWFPDHIKDGRFGNFLESNVDWALSRERYWGTPLPIWKCRNLGCDHSEAVCNYDDLMARPGVVGMQAWLEAKRTNPELPDDLKVHKPYIDAIKFYCPKCSPDQHGNSHFMERVPEVIDCWYDSGSMPFAQWGYPKVDGSEHRFSSQFPADFISEAIDQTRGWFYSQLAISTLLFGRQPLELTEILASADKQELSEKFVASLNTSDSKLAIANSEALSREAPDTKPYPHPFRNCIVLGLMLGEDGQKMSKSKRNYLPPNEIFDKYGADALRWYFFANQPPWTSIRYSEQSIKDSIPEFLLRLWNVYSFFVIYANIDGFDPSNEIGPGELASASGSASPGSNSSLDPRAFTAAKSYRPVAERSELDRWILSELNRTVAAVVERMDVYDNFAACGNITEFVDALSNWYVRRSRDRFWSADKRGIEKLDAYWTLYECLVTSAKLVAPFVPFVAETLWQNLAGVFKQGARGSEHGSKAASLPAPCSVLPAESVHLCDYPQPDRAVIDEALSVQMNLVRLISSLGRNARTSAALKVRQPLSKVEVVLADATHQKWLEEHADVINEELNVKQLEFSDDPSLYVDHEVNPNFKLLGPKLGKLLPKVKAWLAKQSGAELLANIRDNGLIDLEIDGQKIALTREEVEVRIKPKPGWTSANDRGVVVVLSTELTPELVAEGTARDVVRAVQDARKETACDFTDRIELGIVVAKGEPLSEMLAKFGDYIQNETLAQKIVSEPIAGVQPIRAKIGETEVDLYISILR